MTLVYMINGAHRLWEENLVVRVDHVTLACTKMQSQTANACLQKMPLSKLLGALPVMQTRKFSTLLFSSKQVSQNNVLITSS